VSIIDYNPKETKPIIPADESIKSVFLADPKELVKFVNSVMNTIHNPETSTVVQLKTEHVKTTNTGNESKSKMTYDKVIADMLFSIDGKIYGIEFQTVHDNTILCRIAEYQFNAMIDMVKSSGFSNEYEGELPLPRMSMVQLERSNNVPTHYKLWFVNEDTGEKILQQFPIVKIWEYLVDDLSKNGMHLLLPFKIIDIRKSIKGNEMDEETTARLVEMSGQIDSKIMDLFNAGELSYTAMETMYHAHGSLMQYFSDKFISDTNPLKGKVESMFAEVMDRRKIVTREDILREGEARGISQGITQGISQGISQGEQRERREILNTLAQLKVPFDVFKATAEARGVPEEEYLPIYNAVVSDQN